MKRTSKVEPATTTETTATMSTDDLQAVRDSLSEMFRNTRKRRALAERLAHLAAPFAAAGLKNATAIKRARSLLSDCKRAIDDEAREEDWIEKSAPTMTVAQVMARMDLISDKQFKVYAKQIGMFEDRPETKLREMYFSEEDLRRMLEIQKERKKAKGNRRKAIVVSERNLSAMREIQRQRKKAKGTRRKP